MKPNPAWYCCHQDYNYNNANTNGNTILEGNNFFLPKTKVFMQKISKNTKKVPKKDRFFSEIKLKKTFSFRICRTQKKKLFQNPAQRL